MKQIVFTKIFYEKENKTITTYLKNRDYQNALAICLLLKSIPIELQKMSR